MPPPDPNAGIVTAGSGDLLPPGAAQPPAQVQPGEAINHGDGTVSVNVGRGPVRLTREQANALGLQDACTIKTIYDQGTGFTPAQQAEILSGGQPIGTKEEIAAEAAKTKNIQTIQGADKRQYTISYDATTKNYTMVPMEAAMTGDPIVANTSRSGGAISR